MPRVQKKGSRLPRWLRFLLGIQDENAQEEGVWTIIVYKRDGQPLEPQTYVYIECTYEEACAFAISAYRDETEYEGELGAVYLKRDKKHVAS